MPPTRTSPVTRVDVVVLIGLLILCYGVAAIGGAITATTVESWYPSLPKPPLTPPSAVFAPVWLTLYGMMAVAAWHVYRRRRRADVATALALFIVQLVFNLAWPILFFGLRWIEHALVVIVVLLGLLAVITPKFWSIDWRAGVLFTPYLLWVGFATYLNAGIWWLR
jgi:translocator protein